MRETLIETVRRRIEAVRGQAGGQAISGQGILETVRERIATIRAGVPLERLEERFPAVKRIRAQREVMPWEKPALFERAPTRKAEVRKQVVPVTEEAKKPALF